MTDDQLTRADLKGMSPEAIQEARDDGRLGVALGVPADESAAIRKAKSDETLTREDMRTLLRVGREDLIMKANAEGRVGIGDAST